MHYLKSQFVATISFIGIFIVTNRELFIIKISHLVISDLISAWDTQELNQTNLIYLMEIIMCTVEETQL